MHCQLPAMQTPVKQKGMLRTVYSAEFQQQLPLRVDAVDHL